MHILITYKCLSLYDPEIIDNIVEEIRSDKYTENMYDELVDIFGGTEKNISKVTDEIASEYEELARTCIEKFNSAINCNYLNDAYLYLDYILRIDVKDGKAYLHEASNIPDKEYLFPTVNGYVNKLSQSMGIDINMINTTIFLASEDIIIKGLPIAIIDKDGNDAADKYCD